MPKTTTTRVVMTATAVEFSVNRQKSGGNGVPIVEEHPRSGHAGGALGELGVGTEAADDAEEHRPEREGGNDERERVNEGRAAGEGVPASPPALGRCLGVWGGRCRGGHRPASLVSRRRKKYRKAIAMASAMTNRTIDAAPAMP